MKGNAVRQNYLLGTKISFLILSFLILVIAITVHNDIWPFLEESLPPHPNDTAWFIAATVIGLVLPSIWLWQDWSVPSIRYSLISLVFMLLMQILTEISVRHYFFISMIIPTAILYVGYRLIQLVNLHRIIYRLNYASPLMKTWRMSFIIVSVLFWGMVWFKLTFIVFPQLIPDIL